MAEKNLSIQQETTGQFFSVCYVRKNRLAGSLRGVACVLLFIMVLGKLLFFLLSMCSPASDSGECDDSCQECEKLEDTC